MMVVCASTKIPLIVVGKPGSSKTLAMQLIRDAFARSTKSPIFHACAFQDLEMFPYQCSSHSTADGIKGRFTDAMKVQAQGEGKLNSVVFLDEVGLAEDSPAMPLKVLHSLLEYPEVAFVGLSNWNLDPAKMNRCVYLLRPPIPPAELAETAIEILQGASRSGKQVAGNLIDEIQNLTKAYIAIEEKQEEMGYRLKGGGHFIGLRDFYSFVKLVDKSCNSEEYLTGRISHSEMLMRAIMRSFGGFQPKHILEIVARPFWECCYSSLASESVSGPEDIVAYRSANVLELLSANLADLPDENAGEVGARHLMVLSEHESALQLLQQKGIIDISRAKILYGSHFREDRSTINLYRHITTIKNCMETGQTAVLLHLDDIYESLYDMLNQNYTMGSPSLGHTCQQLCWHFLPFPAEWKGVQQTNTLAPARRVRWAVLSARNRVQIAAVRGVAVLPLHPDRRQPESVHTNAVAASESVREAARHNTRCSGPVASQGRVGHVEVVLRVRVTG